MDGSISRFAKQILFYLQKSIFHAKTTRDYRDLTEKNNKAYNSLCKCPVSFSHPSEAIALDGIGAGLVKRLEENMKKYCRENGLPMPSKPGKGLERNFSTQAN